MTFEEALSFLLVIRIRHYTERQIPRFDTVDRRSRSLDSACTKWKICARRKCSDTSRRERTAFGFGREPSRSRGMQVSWSERKRIGGGRPRFQVRHLLSNFTSTRASLFSYLRRQGCRRVSFSTLAAASVISEVISRSKRHGGFFAAHRAPQGLTAVSRLRKRERTLGAEIDAFKVYTYTRKKRAGRRQRDRGGGPRESLRNEESGNCR